MQFVRHSNLPKIGLGVIVRLRDGKWDVLFETETETRAFKPGASVLSMVPDGEVPANHVLASRCRELVDTGGRSIGRMATRSSSKSTTKKKSGPVGNFEDIFQNYVRIQGFGFDSPKNVKEERDYKTALCAHAQTLLGPDALAATLASEGPAGVQAAATKLMQHKDFNFIDKRFGTLTRFTQMDAAHHAPVGSAIAALLQATDDTDYDRAFDDLSARLVDAGIKGDMWQFCTIISALLSPEKHLYVRPAPVKETADALGLELGWETVPTARCYRRTLHLAGLVRDRLAAKDMPAQDMFDIQGFMWIGASKPKPPATPASKSTLAEKDD